MVVNFIDSDLGFDMRLRYWREGESVLDNDTSDLVAPPDVKLSVVEVQGQPINAAGEGATVATDHGTLLMRPNGTFRYSPAAGFVGTDSFTYKAGDGVGVSTLTSVSIRVGLDSSGPTCEELDINASGAVDRRDLATLASLYGSLVQAGATADFNDDGRIGLRDLIYLRDALGQNCGAAAQAVTRHAEAVDRVHSQTTPYRLRALPFAEGEAPAGRRASLPAVTEPVDSVSGRVLRGRRGAWA